LFFFFFFFFTKSKMLQNFIWWELTFQMKQLLFSMFINHDLIWKIELFPKREIFYYFIIFIIIFFKLKKKATLCNVYFHIKIISQKMRKLSVVSGILFFLKKKKKKRNEFNVIILNVSLVLWSLILVVSIKYVIAILSADNRGEGGTFALLSMKKKFQKKKKKKIIWKFHLKKKKKKKKKNNQKRFVETWRKYS